VATGANPADTAQVLKTLQDVWDIAAERMLDAVARRLARGITQPGWAEQKTQEVLALRAELAAIVAQTAQGTPEIAATALDEAYKIGAGAAGVLEQGHIRSRPEVVQQLATRLTASLQGAQLPVIRAHEDLFRQAVGDTEVLMQTGTMVRRDAVAQSVDRLLAQGVDRFKDRSGRRWHLDAYARMAGRTMAGQTMVQGQLDGMVQRGRDLVVISDSARECERCRPWEGRLLSISGASAGQTVDGRQVTGTVAEARGAGLWHPNCTHRADPYTPGLTRLKQPKENAQGYKDQQKLRAYERQARDLKRRLATAEQLGAKDQARKLRVDIRANSARIKAHTEATGQLRKRDRERPVGGGQPATTPRPAATPTPRPTPPDQPAPPPAHLDRQRASEHADRVLAGLRQEHRDKLHGVMTNAFTGVPESKVAALKKVAVVDKSAMSNPNALASYNRGERTITTHAGFLDQAAGTREKFGNWFSDTGDVSLLQSAFDHEFGHHLDMLRNKTQREVALAELAKADPDLLPVEAHDTTAETFMTRNRDRIINKVGTYAGTDALELVAELWAQYRANGTQTALSREAGRLLELDDYRPKGTQ
jgi:hypothetical protein